MRSRVSTADAGDFDNGDQGQSGGLEVNRSSRLRDWCHLFSALWKTFKAETSAAWNSLYLVKLTRKLKTIARSELKLMPAVNLIRRSEFFDADWYLTNNPDVDVSGMDPARHYLIYGHVGNRNPSPYFVNEEYYALHNDVRAAKMNPLLHFERYGRREGRQISMLEEHSVVFPEGTVEGVWRFDRVPRKHGRTAVVASYFGKGEIPETLVYLLNGLREVVDNIVYVADCKVFPTEVEKLRGLVTVAKFERHGQYDFGSYRRGLEICRAEGFVEPAVADELVVVNDSNYGPVFRFSESFAKMATVDCDFWGYTGYNAFGNVHISSYFYDFRRRVLDGTALDEFLAEVDGPIERDKVIIKFEFRLTKYLESKGFAWSTLVPMGFKRGAPTKFPVSLMKKYRMPLLKAKAANGDSYEDVKAALAFVRRVNPALRGMIHTRSLARDYKRIDYAEHQASFPEKCAVIGEKLRVGGRAKAVFFVSSASMFPARPLFEAMLADPKFDAFVCVIPDLRWRGKSPIPAMANCEQEMRAVFHEDRVLTIRPDEFGLWPDVLGDADIACYPSPYELSSFRYNPHYSVGRGFLPICVNYGFYRSVYDRHVMGGQSYTYMWKAFFECEATRQEYADYSILKGANADVVGYVKMDGLATVMPEPHERKRILVAPHHSVEGGVNKTLSLANFIRYADFFLMLPDKFPEIDFVFRPHPFLFQIMSRPNLWGPKRVEAYIAELKDKPNVIWSDGGDYFREFAESDGCIQDCGSYLVEYLYTGKPCCYMLKSPQDIDEKFVQLGKDCLEQCYVAYDVNAIESFIRDVIVGGKDPKRDARLAFAKNVMVNYPHAADAALDSIKKELGL
ncbi:MAG: hypothetical protein MJ240_05290 [Kiritimatiellae bacterium]|nr:hypothetical protein [Kiritimatiellia bacterium]